MLRSDLTISERSIAALDAFGRNGGLVVVVTGRPPRWVHDLGLEAIAHELVLCANGALVYDVANRRVVEERSIPEDVARAVVDAVREAVPEAGFGSEDALGFRYEPSYRRRALWPGDRGVEAVDDVVRGGVAKLLVRHESLDFPALTRAVVDAVGDAAVVTWSSSSLIEISANGVTKAAALAALAEEHGLSREDAVAFGDMPNDVVMLEWAGLGVAVANAHEDVLAIADEVTASNDDDGVAQVVERLLPTVGDGARNLQ